MKPNIIISSTDLDNLEELLHSPAARKRQDLAGLLTELERAEIREPDEMPEDVIMMNSCARIREVPSGREREVRLVYPGAHGRQAGAISIFTPAGSALLGLSVGQVIDWPTVEGKSVQLEVLEVTHAEGAD